MADISKITVLDGQTYNLKDLSAVQSITENNGTITILKRDGTSTSFNITTEEGMILTISATAPSVAKTGDVWLPLVT